VEIPETLYSRSADGVDIAYQVLGDADLDRVVYPGFVSRLEHSSEEPQIARFLQLLASFSRLIVFDKRCLSKLPPNAAQLTPPLSSPMNSGPYSERTWRRRKRKIAS
jgi:hypothetical protein